MTVQEKLAALSKSDKGNWSEEAAARRQNRAWLRRSGQIAVKVLSALKNQQLTQKDLAERMDISPQQVSKIVKGRENLTLDTLSKLEAALNIQLIQVVSSQAGVSTFVKVNELIYRHIEPMPAALFATGMVGMQQWKKEQGIAVFSLQESSYCSHRKATASFALKTAMEKA